MFFSVLSWHEFTVKIGGEIRQGKHVCSIETELHYELLRGTKFPMSLPLHINLSD